VVIGGEQLSKITLKENEEILDEFFSLSRNSSVVLACRVSPKQKAEIVKMVHEKEKDNKNLTTLAIGDGANDVNMITSAHIGIGISGLEGQQAARAADYSIGQFKYLKNLMFTHGREAYRRNSYLILYMLYKNVLLILPVFYYGAYSRFSSVLIYNIYMLTFYNVLFTCVPIFWYCCCDWEFPKE